jgi:endoglucanase
MPGRRSRTAALALACCLAAGYSLSTEPGGEHGRRVHTGPSVAGGQSAAFIASPFWVDPDTDAARQVRRWQAAGRAADARILKRIAERPVAEWPAGDDPAPAIERAVRAAASSGRTVVLVAYDIPHRGCGGHSTGGARDAAAYRDWIGSFARAIGDAPAMVILEPDALAQIADGCTAPEYRAERYALLAQAVAGLKRQPNTRVYLDAGNPAWITDPARMAGVLKRAGVRGADGFSLNVANFQRDKVVKLYGTQLSGELGDAHFTMDTGRNGAGPLSGDRTEAWCNPPGRALGRAPSTKTGNELLDAYLWIKPPGDSDGTCGGGPPAGTWWPEYALALARRASG